MRSLRRDRTQTMDPFDDDIERLLELERLRPDIPPDRVAAIVDAATRSIAAGTIATNAATATEAGSTSAPGMISASKAAVWSVAVFAAGLGTGVALTLWLSGPSQDGSFEGSRDAGVAEHAGPEGWLEPDGMTAARPAAAAEDAGVTEPARVGEPAPAVDRADSGASVRRARTTSLELDREANPQRGAAANAADDALREERLVLESVQSALARGQADAALRQASEHAERFPAGRLASEREALAIRAELQLGLVDEAERRAEAFDRRWPGSILRGSFAAPLRRALDARGPD